MKKLSFLILLISLCMSHTAQTGIMFPELIAESLPGKQVTIPKDCKGKKTIICLATDKKAEADLVSWQQPMYDKFVAKVGMFDGDYNVHLYFMPVFAGINKAAYESTMKKLRADTDQVMYKYVLLYKGDTKELETTLKMTDDNKPYFFVLDENGKIIHTVSGGFTEKKMEELESVL